MINSDLQEISQTSRSPKTLVVFDLDWTLLNIHSNNHLTYYQQNSHLIQAGKEQTWDSEAGGAGAVEYLERIAKQNGYSSLFRYETDLLQTLRAMLARSNTEVAIASYTQHGWIVPPLLRKLGLNEDELKKIRCYTGQNPLVKFTANDYARNEIFQVLVYWIGKNAHLDKIKEHGGLSDEEKQQIILVDDDGQNIRAAKSMNFSAIWAIPSPVKNIHFTLKNVLETHLGFNDHLVQLNKKLDLGLSLSDSHSNPKKDKLSRSAEKKNEAESSLKPLRRSAEKKSDAAELSSDEEEDSSCGFVVIHAPPPVQEEIGFYWLPSQGERFKGHESSDEEVNHGGSDSELILEPSSAEKEPAHKKLRSS